MDMKQAKEYLKCLSNGIDPVTGETLPPGDCCMQPEVAEALKMCVKRVKLTREESGFPANHGGAWKKDEDAMLCALFDDGKSESEIAAQLDRSQKSIRQRLSRIGKAKSKRMSYYTK